MIPNSGEELPSDGIGLGRSSASAIAPDFFSLITDENFGPVCVCRYVSRLLLGHCFGASAAWRLGAGPTRLASPCVTQARSGISTNGDTIMYQNKVTLIGFLGSDAEVRSNDNRSFTTLSLATKSSYKKDGKYISHTEWHRCVVFGKLSEFAGTLKKGAHIQVEGELRSREYDSKKTDSKQRIWEIKVDSILKLDRAEKSAPEDIEREDIPSEEVAA
jgi:single-strand DNA-binding protein